MRGPGGYSRERLGYGIEDEMAKKAKEIQEARAVAELNAKYGPLYEDMRRNGNVVAHRSTDRRLLTLLKEEYLKNKLVRDHVDKMIRERGLEAAA